MSVLSYNREQEGEQKPNEISSGKCRGYLMKWDEIISS